jgi:hypothetical protein
VVDGRIVETWGPKFNHLGLLRQLEIAPRAAAKTRRNRFQEGRLCPHSKGRSQMTIEPPASAEFIADLEGNTRGNMHEPNHLGGLAAVRCVAAK